MKDKSNVTRPRAINDKAALKRKLEEIKLDYDWIERLDLATHSGVEFDVKDVDDDFKREQYL